LNSKYSAVIIYLKNNIKFFDIPSAIILYN
jgi:hypothetical protein